MWFHVLNLQKGGHALPMEVPSQPCIPCWGSELLAIQGSVTMVEEFVARNPRVKGYISHRNMGL